MNDKKRTHPIVLRLAAGSDPGPAGRGRGPGRRQHLHHGQMGLGHQRRLDQLQPRQRRRHRLPRSPGGLRLGRERGLDPAGHAHRRQSAHLRQHLQHRLRREPRHDTGTLSGYAWSTTVGWINFAPTNGGVTVSPAGEFSGYAWGENIGWIKFNGTAQNSTTYKVATTGPLAVTLASFDAQGQADRVVVTWETVSEIDNAGFNLYRGLQPTAATEALLANVPSQAPGSTQGAAYSYDDAAVEAGPDLLVLAGGRGPERRDDAARAGQRDGADADGG